MTNSIQCKLRLTPYDPGIHSGLPHNQVPWTDLLEAVIVDEFRAVTVDESTERQSILEAVCVCVCVHVFVCVCVCACVFVCAHVQVQTLTEIN